MRLPAVHAGTTRITAGRGIAQAQPDQPLATSRIALERRTQIAYSSSASTAVESGELLGEVLGQVADAAFGIAGSGGHTLGAELRPEPVQVRRLITGRDATPTPMFLRA